MTWLLSDAFDKASPVSEHHLVEDFLTAEAVNHYLVPYLERAGATVFTTLLFLPIQICFAKFYKLKLAHRLNLEKKHLVAENIKFIKISDF